MIWFAVGHSLVCVALVLVGIFWVEPSTWWRWADKSTAYVWFGATIWGIGSCSAMMVVAAMQHMRARTVLTPGGRRGFSAFAAGVLAGLVGVVLLTLGVIYLGDYVADGFLVSAGFGLGAWFVMMLMRRVRAGRCHVCGFDVRASLAFGRCPECGSSFYSFSRVTETI